MRNELSSELRKILAGTQNYMLASHRNFAQNACGRDVENLLLTVSSSPSKQINGISELDPGKDWNDFKRFTNDEFTLEPVHVKSLIIYTNLLLNLNTFMEEYDNVEEYESKLLIMLLGELGGLRISRKVAINRVQGIQQDSSGSWHHLITLSKCIWNIYYLYSFLMDNEDASSEQVRDRLKAHLILIDHSPKEVIGELKDFLLLVKLAFSDENSPFPFNPEKEYLFDMQTIQDFIVFLEDLFTDDLRVEDKTAYSILSMINNSVADIDRALDNLPIGHDSNRHTLKVKRSALMDLCIDIEKSYTSI